MNEQAGREDIQECNQTLTLELGEVHAFVGVVCALAAVDVFDAVDVVDAVDAVDAVAVVG